MENQRAFLLNSDCDAPTEVHGFLNRLDLCFLGHFLPDKMANTTVGIIGMGDMGRMYARRFSEAGWR